MMLWCLGKHCGIEGRNTLEVCQKKSITPWYWQCKDVASRWCHHGVGMFCTHAMIPEDTLESHTSIQVGLGICNKCQKPEISRRLWTLICPPELLDGIVIKMQSIKMVDTNAALSLTYRCRNICLAPQNVPGSVPTSGGEKMQVVGDAKGVSFWI